MSTRTIIELNHDYIGNMRTLGDLHDLLRQLGSSEVTGELNRNGGKPIFWNGNHAIRVLGQRHHSEPEWEQASPHTPAHSKSEFKRRVALGDPNVAPPTGVQEVCRFPDCKCPMDPGPAPDWCARGLPHACGALGTPNERQEKERG